MNMKREILFRGKHNNGKWIEGSLLNFRENTYIIPHDSEYCYDDTEKLAFNVEYFEVLPETVGQFTGLCGKNGRKIFEGDIAKTEKTIGYVSFNAGEFKFNWDSSDLERQTRFKKCGLKDYGPFNSLEIIGNIHDNPELLGGEENG